ncbi:hypothetical protein OSTOST_17757, partial [Ostertagia ostertagi]
LVSDDELLQRLAKEKFDVGISEALGICGLGALSTKGDHMNMIDRLKNVIDVLMGERLFHDEIFVDSSFVFTIHANPYLDYPRPMLHKTVPIGGVAVKIDSKKKVLTKEWDDILNETKHHRTGLKLRSSLLRKTLLAVFESMPETTFIWKYEEEGSQIAAYLKNVYLRTWVPQIALL